MAVMNTESTSSVIWIEHQTLEHIKGALHVTLDWQAPSVSQSRKKSSIRFTLQSFCRHLQRVMSIEEEGGYMAVVAEEKPFLEERIKRLARDHDRFRRRLKELVPRLDKVADWDEGDYCDVCDEIRDFLAEVDRHNQAEVDLLQDTLVFDEGGEG